MSIFVALCVALSVVHADVWRGETRQFTGSSSTAIHEVRPTAIYNSHITFSCGPNVAYGAVRFLESTVIENSRFEILHQGRKNGKCDFQFVDSNLVIRDSTFVGVNVNENCIEHRLSKDGSTSIEYSTFINCSTAVYANGELTVLNSNFQGNERGIHFDRRHTGKWSNGWIDSSTFQNSGTAIESESFLNITRTKFLDNFMGVTSAGTWIWGSTFKNHQSAAVSTVVTDPKVGQDLWMYYTLFENNREVFVLNAGTKMENANITRCIFDETQRFEIDNSGSGYIDARRNYKVGSIKYRGAVSVDPKLPFKPSGWPSLPRNPADIPDPGLA